LLSIFCCVAGFVLFKRNITFVLDKEQLQAHIEKSPNTKFWLKKYNMEQIITWKQRVSIPLQFIISVALIGLGAWNLFIITSS
jgi:hypothetical protein